MKTQKRKGLAIAAALVCVIGMTTAAYASGFAQRIIGHFQVGGIEITQIEDEFPDHVALSRPGGSTEDVAEPEARTARAVDVASVVSIAEAREALGDDFAIPSLMPAGYERTGCLLHGAGENKTAELQYAGADGDMISILISSGENGIQTSGDVRVRKMDGVEVYYANGIVLWEKGGFTYELYHMGATELDDAAIGGIIGSLTTEAD
jgi:hypothetical protein